jgi:hypothetical protein
MEERPDADLAMFIDALSLTTMAIDLRSPPEQARMLPPQQYSSGGCPNHPPRRGNGPAKSYAPSSSVPPCSKPSALHPGDASLHQRHHPRRRHQSTRASCRRATRLCLPMTAWPIRTTHVPTKTCPRIPRRMTPVVAIILAGAGATTSMRTGAPTPSHRDPGSFAKTSVMRRPQHGSDPPTTSPSTPGRRIPSLAQRLAPHLLVGRCI